MRFTTATVLTIIAGWLVVLIPHAAEAKLAGQRQPEVRVFADNGSLQTRFLAYAASFHGGVNVALGDVNGDGQLEIVTAPGRGGGPEVRIFSLSGKKIGSFFAYDPKFRGGVHVAADDLNDDGTTEIITGPGAGGGPEVKVFSGSGVRLVSFFAYDPKFRGGVNVAAGAFGKRGDHLIVTGSGYGSSHVRFFTPAGKFSNTSLRPFVNATYGLTVAALQNSSSRSQLLVAPERTGNPTVKVYNLDAPSSPTSVATFAASFHGGVRLAGADVDGNGSAEIVAGAGPGGGPHVRVLTTSGGILRNIMAYESSFRGGVNVAAAPGLIVTGPGAIALDGRTDYYKYIEINLATQTLRYFREGRLLATHPVSTGKWTTPTPIGTFAIKNKIPLAYSKPYDLYMEWWMAFTPDGSYGLHALPFWKMKDGGRRYEGVGHLGTPVSHGCIRQNISDALELYRWADVGTPVIVKRK